MATAVAGRDRIKDFTFNWEGKDKSGKVVKGELRAQGEAVVNATLRRQGISIAKVKQLKAKSGGSVGSKDLSLFTRQLATMMKAGVPLLQSFEIVSKGASNPAVGKLLSEIKSDVETGSSLAQAFRKYPLHFDAALGRAARLGGRRFGDRGRRDAGARSEPRARPDVAHRGAEDAQRPDRRAPAGPSRSRRFDQDRRGADGNSSRAGPHH